MKDNIIYLLFFVLLSTSCKKQTFQIDDIILQCHDSKYQEEGYDIKTIIDDYEKLLVDEGVLKDDSGKSYLEVMRKINLDEDFRIKASPFMEYDPFFKVDNVTKMAVFECERNMLEIAKEKEPKWQKVSDFEAPEIKENPDLIYQVMAETLSEEDLKSYYSRLKMFNLFDMVNTKRWGEASIPSVTAQ